MAQTKRKRQTKHRGNAAGVVESRGRTSRPPSPEERKRLDKQAARERRQTQRPTWNSAARKALLAGAFMFVFLYLLDHPKHGNKVLAAIIPAFLAVCLYLPASYYLELYLWRKRTGTAGPGLFGSVGGGLGSRRRK